MIGVGLLGSLTDAQSNRPATGAQSCNSTGVADDKAGKVCSSTGGVEQGMAMKKMLRKFVSSLVKGDTFHAPPSPPGAANNPKLVDSGYSLL